jgi:hypothetical protein
VKPPICKLCRKAHWTYETHDTGEVPAYVEEMASGAMGQEKRITTFPDPNPAESVTVTAESRETVYVEPVTQKTCNACNKPLHNRGKVCNACRQRAYRERSRG